MFLKAYIDQKIKKLIKIADTSFKRDRNKTYFATNTRNDFM